MSARFARFSAAAATMVAIVGFGSMAGAVDPTPASVATDNTATLVTQLGPAMVAIGSGLIVIAAIWFVVRTVLRATKRGGTV